MNRRVAARAALVVVGVTLCLFGPARHLTRDAAPVGTSPTVAAGVAFAGADQAIAERPSMSAPRDVQLFVGGRSVVLLAAFVVLGAVAASREARVVLAMVRTPWHRRGPPVIRTP